MKYKSGRFLAAAYGINTGYFKLYFDHGYSPIGSIAIVDNKAHLTLYAAGSYTTEDLKNLSDLHTQIEKDLK